MQTMMVEKQLLHTFLASLLRLQNVKRGSIWIKDGEGYLCVEAMGEQSERVQGVSIPADRPSIVGTVIETGTMTIAKPGEDVRHFRQIEDELQVKSTLILAFPLIMKDGRVYGTVELIDTSAGGNTLNRKKEQLDLIQNFVDIGSLALSNFLDYRYQLSENKRLKKTLTFLQSDNPIIGHNPHFLSVLKKVRDYAKVDFPVLITGESGTGKEVLAKEIHRLSARRQAPFLVQNCSAIPETLLESELFGHRKGSFTGATQDKIGLFEAADKGTVFLDEIGDMSLNLQARILRVIQENEIKPVGRTRTITVDVRIISATHVDLSAAIAEKKFRDDLYYRLNVLPLEAPPLRLRRDDIPLLLDFFLKKECTRLGKEPKVIMPEALTRLENYPWPGNIRELENLIKYLIVSVPESTVNEHNLPAQFFNAGGPPTAQPAPSVRRTGDVECPENGNGTKDYHAELFDASWEDMEKSYVYALLEQNRWSITKSARQAGIKRSTFYARMRKLGIEK